ncbi:Metallo-dependent phosphatase-like protein [Delphinella strobiligena]|nr:Metallo-dependent phosphatase-like protein [Delphinella strobiligena]
MTRHTKAKHFAQGGFLLGLFILVTISLITLLSVSPAAHASLKPPIPLASPPSPHPLVTTNGTFQISIFEDLHYGEAENTLWGPQQDLNTTRVMNAVLDAESQQLVVLNGDLITGENTFLHNSSRYIDRIVEPLVRRGVRWASVYGNHDSGFNLSRREIWDRERAWEGCLTGCMVQGQDVGVSNYYIPVYSASATGPPEFLLWFFDSRGGRAFQQTASDDAEVVLQDWVHGDVVNWFLDTSKMLAERYGRYIPSLAFVHIPVSAMLAFQEGGVHAHLQPGINDDVPLSAQGGTENRGVDHGFVKALREVEGLMAVFSGHDHGNTWCQRLTTTPTTTNLTSTNLNLCFGQHTGYGGYGSWIRGSRQVLLRTDRSEIETWVRFEDGSVGGRVVLNATYGLDVYPAVVDRDSYGGNLSAGDVGLR